MSGNNLTNYGTDMSGVIKLAEILPSTSITSLKYALAYLPNPAMDSSHYPRRSLFLLLCPFLLQREEQLHP